MNTNTYTKARRIGWNTVGVVQLVCVVALAVGWLLLPRHAQQRILADVEHVRPHTDVTFINKQPATIAPLYNDDSVVTDAELAAVIEKVVPRFSRKKLRPNYVEHALRIWHSKIEFAKPDLVSGPQMVDYLTDSAAYVDSWGTDAAPILESVDEGIHVRWGKDGSTSVHHDHLLACLAEAGVSLDQPVFTISKRSDVQQVLAQALRDFRLDERETEWSVMAFALYLSPQQTSEWHNAEGRLITFDTLAHRLMRQRRSQGVCLGTHRVYSLMALLRLNEDHGGQLISSETQASISQFLHQTKELLIASQSEDGSWPPNWHDGVHATERRDPDEKLYRRVISTGHHLEWLAIAPVEFHPPHNQIVQAARWVIDNTQNTPQDVIDANYTYYSHFANALALWRGTNLSGFWTKWPANSLQEEAQNREFTGKTVDNP